MILQPIVNIAEICARKGVINVVLSPGSRNAPITLAFARHPEIKIKVISDERSAAFIGMGMALQSRKTVALVCTSGSAAFNYAPAVAEAFFQRIPLLVITADRPPEWIDQLDGQTIRQRNIYGRHVKASFDLPVSYEHADPKWHVERSISEAINIAESFPKGPVHINIPLREPFYPAIDENFVYEKVKVIESIQPSAGLLKEQWDDLASEFSNFQRVILVGGQESLNNSVAEIVSDFSVKNNIPVVGDIISNLHSVKNVIVHPDIIFANKNEEFRRNLAPDLLITFGKSVISKNIKVFLRKYKPRAHWHVQPGGDVADTFQSLTKVIPVNIDEFCCQIQKRVALKENSEYYTSWKLAEEKAKQVFGEFFANESVGEFEAVKLVINYLPEQTSLHLANSMTVRYANLIGLNEKHSNVEVFANRGTSGIDGSNSTAVGCSLSADKPVVLITGDMAFFYDRNAFWHNYPLPNLRIIILNNHAGGIFRLIDGPGDLPELEEYFETHQKLNAKSLAGEFGFEYFTCASRAEIQSTLASFFGKSEKPKILEIETDTRFNNMIFENYRRKIQDINW